jgi:hypothetical protein
MADVTPTYLRGFLVPLALGSENVWDAQSTFTTAEERAGDPVPQQNSPMRLIAKGAQSGTSDLTIETKSPGFAGYGAGFIFTDNETSSTFGRDPQNSLSRFQYLRFSQSSSSQYLDPSALDIGDGNLLVSYFHDLNSGRFLKVDTLEQDDTLTPIIVHTEDASISGYNILSDMCILPDGQIFLCHIAGDGQTVNVKTYVSTDGSTWTKRADKALQDEIQVGTSTGSGTSFENHNLKRLRVEQSNGTILLLLESIWNNTSATKRNRVLQYASTDLGGTFKKITTDTEIEDHSFHSIDLYADKGLFRFAFYGDKDPSYMTLPSAFTSVHSMRSAGAFIVVDATISCNGTNDFMTDGDLSTWTDEGASHHIIARASSIGAGDFRIYWSQDSIEWRAMGQDINGAGRALRTGDTNSQVERIKAVSWSGKTVLVGEADATAANYSMCLLSFGGYSTVTLPPSALANSAISEWNRLSFAYNYPAVDVFSNFTNVSKTAVGGGEALQSGGVFNDGDEFWTTNPTTTGMATADIIDKGLIVLAQISRMQGGNNTTNNRGLFLKIDDTTEDYEVEVRVSPTEIKVRDVNGSADVITIGSLSLNVIDLLVAFSSGSVTVYYRDVDTINNRRVWVDAGTYSSLTDGGGGASNLHRVRWGHIAYSGVGTLQTNWTNVSFAQGFQISEQLHDFTNPDDLMHRAYPTIERFAYVADNVQITTADGQSYIGDEYRITPDSDFSINNVFYNASPTPRVYWKSESVTSGSVPENFIALKLNPDTSIHKDESLPNDIIGVHLSGHNFRNARLQYYSLGTWTTIDTFEAYIETGGVVNGRTLTGVNTATNQPYFKYNECAGWRARIETSRGVYEWRTVVSNSEGKFGGTATGTKQAVLQLDEDITVSVTPNEIDLIPNSMTLLVNLNGQKVEALGLRILAQETYEKDFRIGLLHVGTAVIPGKQYQRGRTITISSGTETTETQSGVIYARNYRPSRRVFRLAWTEGIDISELQGSNPDPDYWIADAVSGQPIAIANDVPDLLQGLLDYLQGEKTPIVYLPMISKSTTPRELLRENEQALVMLVGDVQVENVLGDELVSTGGELMRIATLTLQEVI